MTFFGRRGQFVSWLPGEAHSEHGAHGNQGDHPAEEHPGRESPPVMLIPLAGLALGATLAGVVFHWFIGEGVSDFWRNSLFLGPANHILEEMERVPGIVSLSPTLMMLAGTAAAAYLYLVDREAPERLADAMPALYRFLLNKWYFDELYDVVFVRPAFFIGRLFWRGGDGAIIDGLGPDGISARVLDVTRSAVRLQSGYVYQYAFAMLLGVAALVTWYLFGGGR